MKEEIVTYLLMLYDIKFHELIIQKKEMDSCEGENF